MYSVNPALQGPMSVNLSIGVAGREPWKITCENVSVYGVLGRFTSYHVLCASGVLRGSGLPVAPKFFRQPGKGGLRGCGRRGVPRRKHRRGERLQVGADLKLN